MPPELRYGRTDGDLYGGCCACLPWIPTREPPPAPCLTAPAPGGMVVPSTPDSDPISVDPDIQTQADARFEKAIEETGARDPREFYRGMLRELKAQDPDAYTEAVRLYHESVIRAIAQGEADPLEAWLEFGRALAERLHPGRTVEVDATGRASTLEPPARWDRLTLHLPDDERANAVPIGLPPELTSAQRATVDLLAFRKVRLPEA